MVKRGQQTEGSYALSLEEALQCQERRANSDLFVGIIVPDRNFADRLLIVCHPNTFYSVHRDDILDSEKIGGAEKIWVRNGSSVWLCTRSPERQQRHSFGPEFSMESLSPPAPRLLPGAPQAGTAADQRSLSAGTTIEGAAKLFASSCEGNDSFDNNCAHFLSDAFIRTGFSELRNANGCINARCGTTAKRPIRARDMWCWFKSKANESGTTVKPNTGIWAVFQLNESEYWGGHVVIIDSQTWKYYGTGWYGDWDQYSYKW